MATINTIREFLDERQITRYRLHKDTGISLKTAYALWANPSQLPASTVIARICEVYKVQPGEFMQWRADN